MGSGQYGRLGDADKAVRRFVVEELEGKSLQLDCAKAINIDVEFSRFLRSNGVPEVAVAEIAIEQRLLVRRRLNEQIQRWTGQGLGSPFHFSVGTDDVVISWRHERFTELTGAEGPNREYVAIYQWLGSQTDRAFLLPCICFLKLLRCNPIYITDGARDEGIDCIGLIASGGLRSTAIFVQARSSIDLFSGDPLLQEYAKYAALPRTHKYMQYLDALAIPKLQDGAGFLYAVLTNSDFRYAAQQNAARLGVLLRSRRQVAQFLSSGFTLATLEELKAKIVIPAAGDLFTNFALQLP